MKMNLEIDENKETQLSTLKGKMLMKDNFLYKIEDYKIEEVTETPKKTFFNRNPKPRTKLILTSITMRGYHADGKFLGYMKEDACQHILVWFDLFWFRKTWVAFTEALQAFGYKITEIKKSNDVDLEKAAEEHLKEFFKNNGYENQQDIIKYAVSFHRSLKGA